MDKFVIRSKKKKKTDLDDSMSSEETCRSSSKTSAKIFKLDQKLVKNTSEKNSNLNASNEKKDRYPWLNCDNGKIGCLYCKNVGELKTCKSQGVEISSEWNQINVDGGTNFKLVTRLSILRHKISRHNRSKVHKFALNISKDKTHNQLETNSKISILIDELTTNSSLPGMIIYPKASISYDLPIFIFLDLIELKSQTSTNIIDQLLECLHKHGFTDIYLKEHWISFVTDGASVLLGKTNGVAARLKEKFPIIFSWHYINYRLELAVNDVLKDITTTYHFKHFLDTLYSLYSRSPKNQNELKLHLVLDVCWVASSYRTVKVVWKMYPALYKHFKEASEDKYRDQKTRSKYKDLQSHETTLIEADNKIRRGIRVIDSLKTINGDYYAEAIKAIEQMMFKDILEDILLCNNIKLVCINKNQFITNNNEEDKIIIQDIQILDKKTWPADVNIHFGEEEVKQLCNRFLINQEKTIRGLRILIDKETDKIEELNKINNLIKTR
ncbi:hypothetical protein AGLY_007026 [Aphis glycines]|uniref:DUF4371 domain-containing protein n=1 Tax=Aphis glycines TaxID=307491 RepID=A0A6G0TPI6_APHGL|nr:hypothetical protein AGLY_007026 [Aphis glycines]